MSVASSYPQVRNKTHRTSKDIDKHGIIYSHTQSNKKKNQNP